jgi:hypothetical protein
MDALIQEHTYARSPLRSYACTEAEFEELHRHLPPGMSLSAAAAAAAAGHLKDPQGFLQAASLFRPHPGSPGVPTSASAAAAVMASVAASGASASSLWKSPAAAAAAAAAMSGGGPNSAAAAFSSSLMHFYSSLPGV